MIINHRLGSKQFSLEIYREIAASDVIVLGFPLYIYSVPPNMLKTLAVLEECIKKAPSQSTEIRFSGGIGQGAGEMLGAAKNIPIRNSSIIT
jgi:hypothetical protein